MTHSLRVAPASISAPASTPNASPLGRVLVAIDGSRTGDAALALALEFSRLYGSEIIICTVIDKEAAVAAAFGADAI